MCERVKGGGGRSNPDEDRNHEGENECLCTRVGIKIMCVLCVSVLCVIIGTCVLRVFVRLGEGGSAWRHASRARGDGTDYTHT